MVWVTRQTKARATRQRIARDIHGLTHQVQCSQTQRFCFLEVAHRRQEEDELITTKAREDMGVVQPPIQSLTDRREEFIANAMAEGVVDRFKSIQVEKHKDEWRPLVAQLDMLFHCRHDVVTAGQTCERVKVQLPEYPFFLKLAMGDIHQAEEKQCVLLI